MIDINRKREKDTYGKMFQGTNSVNDYLAQKIKREPINYRTQEDLEYEKERAKMDTKVKKMME